MEQYTKAVNDRFHGVAGRPGTGHLLDRAPNRGELNDQLLRFAAIERDPSGGPRENRGEREERREYKRIMSEHGIRTLLNLEAERAKFAERWAAAKALSEAHKLPPRPAHYSTAHKPTNVDEERFFAAVAKKKALDLELKRLSDCLGSIDREGKRRLDKQRKAKAADKMFSGLVAHMNDARSMDRKSDYTKKMEVPKWLG